MGKGGGHSNSSKSKISKSSCGGVEQTSDKGLTSELPLRSLASTRSMTSPTSPTTTDNKNGATSSRSRSKCKVVNDSNSSRSRSSGKIVDDNSNSMSRNKGKVVDGSSNNNNNGRAGDTSGNGKGDNGAPREQDMYMPIANVTNLMRKILPSHAKISDDAKLTMQECLSEYISFVTSEANERCRQEQRKTITAEDLLWSLSKLGFDDQVGPLTLYLQRYREAEGEARSSLRGDSLPPIKRTASDAGLYMQQQPPHYSFMDPQAQYHNFMALNISQYSYLQQPQAFLTGGGASCFTAREQVLPPLPPLPAMGLNYHMAEAAAYRDMQPPPTYHDVMVYREIAPTTMPMPAPAYTDVAGASFSSQATDQSLQAPSPGFDPSAPNK